MSKTALLGTRYAYSTCMRVTYHEQRFSEGWLIGPNGRFKVEVNVAGTDLTVTLDAETVLEMVRFLAHSQLLDRAQGQARDLYPKRRLVGQHKPLKQLPTSPHAYPHAQPNAHHAK